MAYNPEAGAMRTETLTETEARIVSAWRASGMPLGKLLVYAANLSALGGAVSLPGIGDTGLARMLEGYLRAYGKNT